MILNLWTKNLFGFIGKRKYICYYLGAVVLVLALFLSGCEKSNKNSEQVSIYAQWEEPLLGQAGELENAKLNLILQRGTIKKASTLILRLPGNQYPDETVTTLKITATLDGKTNLVPGSFTLGDCPSPSRTILDVPIPASKKWKIGKAIGIQIEEYRMPLRSVNALPIIILMQEQADKKPKKVAQIEGRILPGQPAAIYITAPSFVQKGSSIFLEVSTVDRFGNPCKSLKEPIVIEIDGERPELLPLAFDYNGKAKVKIPPLATGTHRVSLIAGKMEIGRSNPFIVVKDMPPLNYYWGDLHSHTGISDAFTTAGPEQAIEYAKNTAHLDFAAVTDHGEPVWGCPISELQWKKEIEAVELAHAPGKFVPFLGFEWTGSFPYEKNWPVNEGHATVIFPDLAGTICRADMENCNSFEKLVSRVAPFSPLIFRHHVCASWAPVTFPKKKIDGMDVIEIFSSHGSCECVDCPQLLPDRLTTSENYVQAALLTGVKYGLIAGTDNHHAQPGARSFPNKQKMILDSGGMTCVLSDELTRKGVLTALRERRCYATTSSRIILRFSIDEIRMGGVLIRSGQGPLKVNFEVHGTDRLQNITLFKGDLQKKKFTIAKTFEPEGFDFNSTWTDPMPPAMGLYYLRVIQQNGLMAWSSPIWIE